MKSRVIRSLLFAVFFLLTTARGFAQPERLDSLISASWDSCTALFAWDTVFYTVGIPTHQLRKSDERKLKDTSRLRESLLKSDIVIDSLFRRNDSVFITTRISGDTLSNRWENSEKTNLRKWAEDKFSKRFDLEIHSIGKYDGTGIQRRQGADVFITSMTRQAAANSLDTENKKLLEQLVKEANRCCSPPYTAERFEAVERTKGVMTAEQKHTFRENALKTLKRKQC